MHRKQLRALALYNGIFVLAANLLAPLYSVYVEQFQHSVFVVSLSWSVFLVATTVFSVAVPRFCKSVRDQERFLLAGYLIRAVVWMSFIFARTIPMLLVLQVVLGLGEALGSPAFDALFADKIGTDNKIRHYSRWKVISNVMTAVGTAVGGSIVAFAGFAPLFAIMSLLAIVSFAGILLAGTSKTLSSWRLPTLTLATEELYVDEEW